MRILNWLRQTLAFIESRSRQITIIGPTLMLVLFLFVHWPLWRAELFIIWLLLWCPLTDIPEWLLEHKDFFPLFAPWLVLVTFIFDRYTAYRLRRKEARRSWYLKALIDPHFKDVETFFSELPELYKSSLLLLKRQKNRLEQNDYLALQTRLNDKFQRKKRQLEFDFIAVFNRTNPKIADQLTTIFMELEDLYISGLDSLEDNFDSINNEIAAQKAEVVYILAQPLHE